MLKDNKELQVKHSKVCSEVKVLKDDKEMILKEKNSLSVAFRSNKKEFESHLKDSDKEREALLAEIVSLGEYKI